jgi:hypothetical protein
MQTTLEYSITPKEEFYSYPEKGREAGIPLFKSGEVNVFLE